MLRPLPGFLLLSAAVLASSSLAQSKVAVPSGTPRLKSTAFYLDFGASSLGRLATSHQKAEISKVMTLVRSLINEYSRDGIYPGMVYEIDFSSQVTSKRPSLISLVQSGMSYAGGAHPSHYTTGMAFFLDKGKAKRAVIEDLLTGPTAIQDVDSFLIRELLVQNASFYGEAPPLTLGRDLLSNFSVGKEGVTWHFPPYAVASYAEGGFEVTLSWKELGWRLAPSFRP